MTKKPWDFQSLRYKNRLLHSFKPLFFEFLSFYGYLRRRLFKNIDNNEIYLNIGCGQNLIPNFLNLDFYNLKKSKKVFEHDLREKLPLKTNRFQGVISEHTLEHLYPNDAISLLNEIFRVLQPGGILRICVPDLDKYLSFCNGNFVHETFSRYENKCEAMWHLTQNNLHLSLWNFEMLFKFLSEIGYIEIEKSQFRGGNTFLSRHDSSRREWESLYVEAKKPI